MMLIAGVGPAAADLLDDTRIAAGPYQVVQHAYRIIALVSELLHHRHGPGCRSLQRLGDLATTTLLELQDHLADTTTQAAPMASSRVRTLRPLPVHLPPPRLGA